MLHIAQCCYDRSFSGVLEMTGKKTPCGLIEFVDGCGLVRYFKLEDVVEIHVYFDERDRAAVRESWAAWAVGKNS
jgi:hypothetical protein